MVIEDNVVYVAETVSYDSSWILGIFTTREGAISACRDFIGSKIEEYKGWKGHTCDSDTNDFAREHIEYYTMLDKHDFFDNRKYRDGSIDSPIVRVYELDRYIE